MHIYDIQDIKSNRQKKLVMPMLRVAEVALSISRHVQVWPNN